MKSLLEVLIRIPEDLSRAILTHWLFGEGIALLDTAFCSKVHRYNFLHILKGSFVECKTAPKGEQCEAYVLWSLQRFVKISVLQVPTTQPHPLFQKCIAPYLSYVSVSDVLHLNIILTASQHLGGLELSMRTFTSQNERIQEPADELLYMKEISVNYCTISEDICKMVHKMPNLCELYVCSSTLNNPDVNLILQYCQKLEYLRLVYCPAITEQFLHSDLLVKLDRLKELNLLGTGVCLTDTNTAVQFTKVFPKLKSLTIPELSTDALISLCMAFCLLQHLTVSRPYSLTESAISSLAQHCPSLQQLFLRGTCGISDRAIFTLVDHCPGITHLGLSSCCRLSLNGYTRIVAGLNDLLYLSYYTTAGVVLLRSSTATKTAPATSYSNQSNE